METISGKCYLEPDGMEVHDSYVLGHSTKKMKLNGYDNMKILNNKNKKTIVVNTTGLQKNDIDAYVDGDFLVIQGERKVNDDFTDQVISFIVNERISLNGEGKNYSVKDIKASVSGYTIVHLEYEIDQLEVESV